RAGCRKCSQKHQAQITFRVSPRDCSGRTGMPEGFGRTFCSKPGGFDSEANPPRSGKTCILVFEHTACCFGSQHATIGLKKMTDKGLHVVAGRMSPSPGNAQVSPVRAVPVPITSVGSATIKSRSFLYLTLRGIGDLETAQTQICVVHSHGF